MNLIIDVGNTNIVFGVFKGHEIITKWRISTRSDDTVDDYWIKIKPFVDDISKFEAIVICSVVIRVGKILDKLCQQFFNLLPLFVNQQNAGVDVHLKSESVGPDRLVNIVAATHAFPGRDLLIVDIGTASTFDLVDSDARYYGSVISPGPDVIVKAFSYATALLPSIAFCETENIVANTLIPSMESGSFWGYISLVDGMIKRIVDEEKKKFFVVATGGFIEMIAPKIVSIDNYDIDLTLKGANLVLYK